MSLLLPFGGHLLGSPQWDPQNHSFIAGYHVRDNRMVSYTSCSLLILNLLLLIWSLGSLYKLLKGKITALVL